MSFSRQLNFLKAAVGRHSFLRPAESWVGVGTTATCYYRHGNRANAGKASEWDASNHMKKSWTQSVLLRWHEHWQQDRRVPPSEKINEEHVTRSSLTHLMVNISSFSPFSLLSFHNKMTDCCTISLFAGRLLMWNSCRKCCLIEDL